MSSFDGSSGGQQSRTRRRHLRKSEAEANTLDIVNGNGHETGAKKNESGAKADGATATWACPKATLVKRGAETCSGIVNMDGESNGIDDRCEKRGVWDVTLLEKPVMAARPAHAATSQQERRGRHSSNGQPANVVARNNRFRSHVFFPFYFEILCFYFV